MSHSHKRQRSGSVASFNIPKYPIRLNDADKDKWAAEWDQVFARDLITSHIVSIGANKSVEDACDLLLQENISCLAIDAESGEPGKDPYIGLFDFSDVNAFLTLAATRHTLLPQSANTRVAEIFAAAREGHVPVRLVCDLSEKNPLVTLPNDATILSLLKIFSTGAHRVLIRSSPPSSSYIGIVSDTDLLSWFSQYATRTPSIRPYFTHSLQELELPSLHIYDMVVACKSDSTVLHAMKLMSEEGVSSVAVIDAVVGNLISAVSVTDIGRIVVPSQNNQILSTPLSQFVAYIKEPDGSTDGVDKYPVYSVFCTSSLDYTIQKLLATKSHRLFITEEPPSSSSPVLSPPSPSTSGLSGIVSVVDILSLFARLAQIPDVDPTRMQRKRRASTSSTSSNSSRSDSLNRSGLLSPGAPKRNSSGIDFYAS